MMGVVVKNNRYAGLVPASGSASARQVHHKSALARVYQTPVFADVAVWGTRK